MHVALDPAYGITLHGLFVVLALLSYVIAARAFNQRRHPTAAIAWVFFILLFPYVALPVFIVFGSRKEARPLLVAASERFPESVPWSVRTIAALGQPAPVGYRDLRLHVDGTDAEARLWETIGAARETIDICTFIIGRDPIGERLIAVLVAKARAGVKVRLMVDGVGRLMRRHPGFTPLLDAGARFTTFVPPLRLPIRARSNLRDHRKLVIVDASGSRPLLWCGGRNFASEYFSGSAGKPGWIDLTFDVGGELVAQAAALFDRDWAYANGERRVEADRIGTSLPGTQAACSAQLIASGPDEVDDTVQSVLVAGAYQAMTRIILVTPYFVPDSALLTALCMAARRGVAVDVLLPARSNHPMSDIARRRALRTLSAAGGRISLLPGMLHAKLAVVDDDLALSGSANFDSRSLFLNYELMVAFHERADVARFVTWYEHNRAPAVGFVPRQPGLVTDIAEGLVLWTGFQL